MNGKVFEVIKMIWSNSREVPNKRKQEQHTKTKVNKGPTIWASKCPTLFDATSQR